ncbi:MAG: bifunctional DNA primase/polymerase, partial [Microcoleus sp. Co-bin12]|nr:bifunctional DNA primase/polymerase [Microcoleus sp. Co-bin12]
MTAKSGSYCDAYFFSSIQIFQQLTTNAKKPLRVIGTYLQRLLVIYPPSTRFERVKFMYDNSTPIRGKASSDIGALIAAINKFPTEWALTPCVGKRNLWPQWQKTKLDRAQLIEAIQSQTNHEGKKTAWTGVSIVTGPMSGGVMAIDFDGRLAWKKYLELSGD